MSKALSLNASDTRLLLDVVYALEKDRVDRIMAEAKRKRQEARKK